MPHRKDGLPCEYGFSQGFFLISSQGAFIATVTSGLFISDLHLQLWYHRSLDSFYGMVGCQHDAPEPSKTKLNFELMGTPMSLWS